MPTLKVKDENGSFVPVSVGNADTVDGMHASDFAYASDFIKHINQENPHGLDAADVGAVSTINGKTGQNITLDAADVGALATSGGTLTGSLSLNGMILTAGVDYGTSLPDSAPVGTIFFLEVDE